MLALVLCSFAVSCSGPVFFKPPVAAVTPVASAPTPPPLANTTSTAGASGIFVVVGVLVCALLGILMFAFGDKAAERPRIRTEYSAAPGVA